MMRNVVKSLVVTVCLAVLPMAQAASVSPQGAVRSSNGTIAVRYEKTTLANGLELILVEDHRLPLVAVNLWVHSGPRNEAAGQTGFAHLFEHLMFAGSRHIPRGGADKIIDAAGGTDSNGSTSFDRTNYYYTLPSNQLELGLWIKSDMLGYMIDQVDAVALANQQDVVRNERRQSRENPPYAIVREAMYQALFPPGHPYRGSIIGSHEDIQSIKLADVRAFARTYYRPNNATLVLAGDFKPAEARRLVQKYFGSLKAGDPVPPVAVAQPVIEAEKRLQITDRVQLPLLSMAWHTPAGYKPGDAELDVAAFVLGGGKSSRLYKTLVYDQQLAQSVSVSQQQQSLGSVFQIQAIARPGKALGEIEPLVDAGLAELARTPPSAEEVARAIATIETGMVAQLEKVGSLADTINAYNQFTGDPGYIGKDLARYRAVTPQAVSAAVAQYLRKNARVVVLTVPGPKVLAPDVPTPPMPVADAAGIERETINADEAWRATQPPGGRAAALTLPAGRRYTLANGLTVVHVPKPGLPLVSVALVLRAGQITNPADRPGLASFTAGMLQEGTTNRSAQQLANELADIGAELGSAAGSEEARVTLTSLKSQFAKGLGLLADVALNPVFNPAEIGRQQASRLASLAQQRDDPRAISSIVGNRAVYGDGHPLAVSALGTADSIRAVDQAALKSFWQAHYRPDQAALVVGGDITPAELRRLAERLFGGWPRGPREGVAAIAAPKAVATAARVVMVDKPGAPQTALAVVAPGPVAALPEAESLKVANAALGGLFTSRINTQLREVKGYTYGVFSSFAMGREIGQFGVRGSVRTDVTGPALTDMFKEIDTFLATPMGVEELQRVRNAQLLSLPGLFDTNAAAVDAYAVNWARGLPADHVVKLPSRVAAVTATSAHVAAKAYLDPARLIVVAVGDQAKVLPQLEALGRQPLQLQDTNGAPVKPATR